MALGKCLVQSAEDVCPAHVPAINVAGELNASYILCPDAKEGFDILKIDIEGSALAVHQNIAAVATSEQHMKYWHVGRLVIHCCYGR